VGRLGARRRTRHVRMTEKVTHTIETFGLSDVANTQTRPARPDRKEVDLRRLVAGFLRMAPDVAIVGEVRDREALPRDCGCPSVGIA
jgi:pilus assembly protein CpaF